MNGQHGSGVIITTKHGVISNRTNEESPAKMNAQKLRKFTLFFNEQNARDEQLSGGKGSSLAILMQLSNDKIGRNAMFSVPPGFTLTTAAFDHHLKHNARLNEAIVQIEHIAYNRSSGNLDDACKELSKLLIETPIQATVLDQITKAFTTLKNDKADSAFKVAVRSSAIGEDGVESSSAGQNETFLGVQSIDDVLMAIQKCWASLFAVQSITYRVQNLQPINTKMAVVIQEMIAPDCAGVLFTQHPVTKNPSKLVITANYGLGEVSVKLLFCR